VTEACIVGWAHSPFGKLEDKDIESLIERVVRPAIEDAGIPAADVDAVFVGQFNSGFSKQNFPASLAMQSVPELRFKPATRCENAPLPMRLADDEMIPHANDSQVKAPSLFDFQGSRNNVSSVARRL
jgi:hypothetical protein